MQYSSTSTIIYLVVLLGVLNLVRISQMELVARARKNGRFDTGETRGRRSPLQQTPGTVY